MLHMIDAVRISRMPSTTIRRFIKSKRLTPVVAGRPGRSYATKFSYGTVFGLVVVQAYRDVLGCKPDNAKELLDGFTAVTDKDFAAMIDRADRDWESDMQHAFDLNPPPRDPYREEAAAKSQFELLTVWPKQVFDLVIERSSELFAHYRKHHQTAKSTERCSGRTTAQRERSTK